MALYTFLRCASDDMSERRYPHALASATRGVHYVLRPPGTVVAGLVLSRVPAAAAQQRPMTTDDLSLLRGVSDPRVSPDGRTVAYVRTTFDYPADKVASAIVLVDAASGTTRHVLSGSAPLWSPDGRSLAFRDDAESHSGIWIYDVATEHRRFLVSVATTNAWLGSLTVKNFAWAPDGSAIAFVGADSVAPVVPLPSGDAAAASDVEVFSRVMYKTRTGFSDNRRTHLYVVPITCGAAETCPARLLTPGSSMNTRSTGHRTGIGSHS